MRRLRTACLVLALVALLWTLPVGAQPDGLRATSWEGIAGRIVDWGVDLWRIVSGSQVEPPPAEPVESDSPDGIALDGSGETSFGTDEPEGDKTPAVDPDG